MRILTRLRQTDATRQGYTAGNILNLLVLLQSDLRGQDFSHLTIWQADLRDVNLQQVGFPQLRSGPHSLYHGPGPY